MAFALVKRTEKKYSFHEKIKQISAAAAIPGRTIGRTTRVSSIRKFAPSIRAASITSVGTSLKNERIIQIAIGKFMAAYTSDSAKTLSKTPSVLNIMNKGRIEAAAGINRVEMKKNNASWTFTIGRILKA